LNYSEAVQIIIFTDLDGSLLNHDDYSLADARPALELLDQLKIPLIICTSKTRLEIELIQAQQRLKGAFISENGGAIFFPRGQIINAITEGQEQGDYDYVILGTPYATLRAFINQVREKFGIIGFGDLQPVEIASLTGLNMKQAERARQREFSEPFTVAPGTDIHELARIARTAGIQLTRGGRFWHMTGSDHDKGSAVKLTKEILSRHFKRPLFSIGLGDSPNDIPMLLNVDLPILIPKPDGTYEDIFIPNLTTSPHPGARGWNVSVLQALQSLKTRPNYLDIKGDEP